VEARCILIGLGDSQQFGFTVQLAYKVIPVGVLLRVNPFLTVMAGWPVRFVISRFRALTVFDPWWPDDSDRLGWTKRQPPLGDFHTGQHWVEYECCWSLKLSPAIRRSIDPDYLLIDQRA
jgi:hypothetical protein